MTTKTGAKTSRFLKGFVANIYGQVVTTVIQLAGVPVFLYAWGAELYGEWLILFAIPAYFSMTDLGFSQSAANDMTALVARGDYGKALRVFQSLIVLVFSSALLVAIISSLLLCFLPLEAWISPGRMTLLEVRWVLWLLIMTVLAQLPDGITHAGFRSNGDYALHQTLYHSARLCQFAALWGTALAGGGPLLAAASFLIVRVIATALFSLLLLKRHTWLQYGFRHAARRELERLFRPALANIALPAGMALNIQGMVLAVGSILGPSAVVVFSTLRTLSRLVLQLIFSLCRAAEPELAAAHGAGDGGTFASLLVKTLRAGFWFGLVGFAGLGLAGSYVVNVWTHGKVAFHQGLFSLLLASSFLSVFWYSGLAAFKAANRHLRPVLTFTMNSAAAVLLAGALMAWTQRLETAGLALLIADVLLCRYMFPKTSQLAGEKTVFVLAAMLDPRPLGKSIWGLIQGFSCSGLATDSHSSKSVLSDGERDESMAHTQVRP